MWCFAQLARKSSVLEAVVEGVMVMMMEKKTRLVMACKLAETSSLDDEMLLYTRELSGKTLDIVQDPIAF